MKQETFIKIALALIVIGLFSVVYVLRTQAPTTLGAPGTLTFDRSEPSSASVSSTIVKVMDTNPQRVYMAIVNDGSNAVYCALNATSTGMTAGEGIRLNSAGGSLELADGSYVGQVWCLTSSGTSSLAITEK